MEGGKSRIAQDKTHRPTPYPPGDLFILYLSPGTSSSVPPLGGFALLAKDASLDSWLEEISSIKRVKQFF